MTRDVLLSFLLILTGYFLPAAVALTCRPDWLLFQEKCYGFGEDVVSWGDADDICRTFGAKLAEIETAAENNFLKSTCNTKHVFTGWAVPIFSTRVCGRWVSNGEQINSFTDWAHGQPNENGGQDCLALYRSEDYEWADEACNNARNFICEGYPLETVVG